MQGVTHIIGAGLAGLAAATALAAHDRRVCVYESAAQAGGRCRSYYDSAFGANLDNGNHLLLSGNTATLAYLRRIGTQKILDETAEPIFHFIDAKTNECWSLHLNKGCFPFWLFDKNRRVPGTHIGDYFSAMRLLCAKQDETVGALLNTGTLLYQRLWHPVLLAALNTELTQGSARLAGTVLRDTLCKGGRACIPIIAEGLSFAFIDPALSFLAARSAKVMLNQRVKSIRFEGDKATLLEFENDQVPLSAADTVICATSSFVAATLLPGITTPEDTRAILNVHFRITPPSSLPKILGVVNATSEWIFAFADRISVTVSAADRLMQEEREALATRIWLEVASIAGLDSTLPPWQIVKEKRATFAATPAEDAKRPHTQTRWKNVYLAGDYVQTGLPATIESAVRSGENAATYVMKRI